MKITIPTFKGMRPKAAAHLLEAGEAQLAVNLDFDREDLRPLRRPLKVAALSDATVTSLFRWTPGGNEVFIAIDSDVDFARSPVADDSFERVYMSGKSEPRFFANDNLSTPFDPAADYVKLGVPAPGAALTATGYTGSGSTYRAYTYCYVNRYGEEGPPADLVELSDYASGNVTLANFAAAPSGRAIDKIRVYRVNTSGAEYAAFQLVFATDLMVYDATHGYVNGDLVVYSGNLFKCVVAGPVTGVTPAGAAAEWDAWADSIADIDLQPDTLVSESWAPPPAGLKGIVPLPNGCLAGFVDNTIYLSEPYYPHAWPSAFTVPLAAPIVALRARGTGLIALTAGPAWLVAGAQPDQMSIPIKVGEHPCLAKRGVVDTPDGAMYPAKVGLVLVNENGATVATEQRLSAADWAAYVPAAITAAWHDGRYIGFYNTAAGFVADFKNKGFGTLDFYAYAVHVSDENGELYIVAADAVDPDNPPATIPLAIQRWAADDVNSLYARWKSGVIQLPVAANLGVARVTIDEQYYQTVIAVEDDAGDLEAYNAAVFAAGIDGGLAARGLTAYGFAGDALHSVARLKIGETLTFKLYADRVLKKTRLITDSRAFRLPGGYRCRRLEVELEGYVPGAMVELASGMEELYTE